MVRYEIWVKDHVPTPGFEGCYAWSPDGQSIAYCYVLVQQDLVRVDVSGLLGCRSEDRAGFPVCPTKLASSLIFAIQR